MTLRRLRFTNTWLFSKETVFLWVFRFGSWFSIYRTTGTSPSKRLQWCWSSYVLLEMRYSTFSRLNSTVNKASLTTFREWTKLVTSTQKKFCKVGTRLVQWGLSTQGEQLTCFQLNKIYKKFSDSILWSKTVHPTSQERVFSILTGRSLRLSCFQVLTLSQWVSS